MKQLLSLFLFLLPCLAWAQYQGNGNQKITLGEQTTADGLIWRGVLADTGNITPSSDTSAYIILDTVNSKFYHYNRTTTYWALAGGGVSVTSFSAGSTGLTPSTATTGAVTLGGTLAVANGGTGRNSLTENKLLVGNNTGLVITANDLHFNSSTNLLGIGETNPTLFKLTVKGAIPVLFDATDTRADITYGGTRYFRNVSTNGAGNGFQMSFNNNLNELGEYAYIGSYIIDNTSTSRDGGLLFMTTNNNVNRQEVMRLLNNGNVGIGTISPTAKLHLKAGTATTSTAPLKFTSGTNLTTVEAGAMEFNGTNLLFSPSTTRHTVNHGLTGSNTLDFLSTNAQSSRDMTITVTGAADGDVVSLGVPNVAVNANTSYSAWVSAANTVTVRFNNYSSDTVDPASGLFKVFVTK